MAVQHADDAHFENDEMRFTMRSHSPSKIRVIINIVSNTVYWEMSLGRMESTVSVAAYRKAEKERKDIGKCSQNVIPN
jgi:hypothetical protein